MKLTVIEPFLDYVKGEVITLEEDIDVALKHFSNCVVKTFEKVEKAVEKYFDKE